MSKTPFQTAISIANSMIGSAMIIFPLNYLNQGIILNLIFLIFMGMMLSTTCTVYGNHLLPHQKDLTESIRRILGEKFFKVGAVLSGILVTLVSCLFFLMASDIIYDVLCDISGGEFFLSEKLFKFLLLMGFASLTFLKDLRYVFKLSSVAMASLIASTLVLMLSLPQNWSNIDEGAIEFKPFSFAGLLAVISINGFAFTCHPSVTPLLKENSSLSHNTKAIYLGFGISCFLYLIVGIGGSLSIYGLHPAKTANVMDYFVGEWQAIVIGLCNFIYFLLIFPIFPFVAKTQLTSLVPQDYRTAQPNFEIKFAIGFEVIWLALNAFFIIAEADPGVVMGFLGSVVAFYFTYVIPTLIMFKKGNSTIIDHQMINTETEGLYSNLLKNQGGTTQTSEHIINSTQKSAEPINPELEPQVGAESVLSYDTGSIITVESSSEVIKVKEQSDIAAGTGNKGQDSDEESKQAGERYSYVYSPITAPQKVIYGGIMTIGCVVFVCEVASLFVAFS